MKIKISYQEFEQGRAKEVEDWIKWRCGLYGDVKVTKSDRHEPFFHTYLAVKNNENPHK